MQSSTNPSSDISNEEAALPAWHLDRQIAEQLEIRAKEAETIISSLRSSFGQAASNERLGWCASPTDIECVACRELPQTFSLGPTHGGRRKSHTVKAITGIFPTHPDSGMISYAHRYGLLPTMSMGFERCPLYKRPNLINTNGVLVSDASRVLLEHGVHGREVYSLELNPDAEATLRHLGGPKGTAAARAQSWADYSTCKHIQLFESQLSQLSEARTTSG